MGQKRMRRKLYAMMNNVCNLFVLGSDLLNNKVPCQMQCKLSLSPRLCDDNVIGRDPGIGKGRVRLRWPAVALGP